MHRGSIKRKKCVAEAQAHLGAKRFRAAGEALRPIVASSQQDPEVLYILACVAEGERQHLVAATLAQQSLDIQESVGALLLLARCNNAGGASDRAIELCDRALKIRPRDALTVHLLKAGFFEAAGRYDEARAIIQPMIEDGTAAGTRREPYIRHEWAKLLVHDKRPDEAIEVLDALIADRSLPEQFKRVQLELKAKACDRAGRYADAWEAAIGANSIGARQFDPDVYDDQVNILRDSWSKQRMADFPLAACDSQVPVFVAGMPRSGTSLIDQIIDAHPRASGVGELSVVERFAAQLSEVYDEDAAAGERFGPYDASAWTRVANDYVDDVLKISPEGTQRVVNKALGNNKLVGLIARLFPRTRIIHAVRDPRDVAVSCFLGGFNNTIHAWTTRPDWIASAWAQSQRMMDHWKATLDVPILDVRYESLVQDPASQFPRIIEFLGLDWDDACNSFYNSRRTVRTLSYDQVNRPLYTSSVGRHARYAEFLNEVEFPEY